MIKLIKAEAKKVLGIDLDWTAPEIRPSRKGMRIYSSVKHLPKKRILEKMIEKKSLLESRGFFLDRTMGGWALSAALVPPKEIADKYVNSEKLKRLLWEPNIKIDETGLLSYQIAGVKRLVNALQKHRRACELSDGGVGKTYMGAAAARHFGYHVMVVCPPVVKTEWRNVLSSFGCKIITIESWEATRSFRDDYYSYRDGWKLPKDSMLILDELHHGKADASQSGQVVCAASRAKCLVLGMTASLATGPHEMHGSGMLFGLHQGGESYERWKSENGCVKGKYQYIYIKKAGGNPMKDIHEQLIPYRGNRIRIADLGDQFPETHLSANAYDAGRYTPKIKQVYEDMLEEIQRIEAKDPRTANASIWTTILRARMQTEMFKVPMMIDLAKDYQDAGYSVALFVSFTKTVYALADGLKTDCIIKGGMTQKQRDEAKRRFQADEVRAVVCNIKSGGASLSLHDMKGKYPRAALISPTWSAINLRQATFRVHRAGGVTKSIQRIVFAANTIEEKVMAKVQAKLENLDSLNDGDLALTEKLYGVNESSMIEEIKEIEKNIDYGTCNTPKSINKTTFVSKSIDDSKAEPIHNKLESVKKRLGKPEKPLSKDNVEKIGNKPGKTELSEEYQSPPEPRPIQNIEKRALKVTQGIEEDKKNSLPLEKRQKEITVIRLESKNPQTREFLLQEYKGWCQIALNKPFPKRDGMPYFEACYLTPRETGEWVDRPGNVLCFSAEYSARWQYGALFQVCSKKGLRKRV